MVDGVDLLFRLSRGLSTLDHRGESNREVANVVGHEEAFVQATFEYGAVYIRWRQDQSDALAIGFGVIPGKTRLDEGGLATRDRQS